MTEKTIRIGTKNGIHDRVETGRLFEDTNRLHKAINFIEGGMFMSDFLDKETFKQFDIRVTDKLNDIRIDTNKIRDIDKKVYEMSSDLSHIKVSTNTLESDFTVVKSDVSVLRQTISDIKESTDSGIKKQKLELEKHKNDISGDLLEIKNSTTIWAIGIIATLGVGFIGTIITLVLKL